jgi:DNA-binding transcriptional LysR family regulator
MELRQLATFRVVAQTLSFTRAAVLLNYAQSSVTAQVQSLEDELDVPLFDRLGRRVVLTDAGQRLLHYAEKLLDLADEARLAVSGGDTPAGVLTIGAPESFCTYRLPVILRQFRERFPHVRLIFRPMPYSALMRNASEGMVDVSFLLSEPLQSSSLQVETLAPEPVRVVAAPSHPLVPLACVTPADVAHETLLLTENGCHYRSLFERALAAEGIYPGETLEFSSVEAIKQCVIASMGIAVLPAMAVEGEIARGQLAALRWFDPHFEVAILMVWHKDKWLSPALSAFMEISRAGLLARA